MNNNNIYIIHKERGDSKLLFMYKPFVNTISKIFSQSKFLYNNWENISFNRNDIIIIIGCLFSENDLINFKNKNLYIIYYWTEPCDLNENLAQHCDEIYLYSKLIFKKQKKCIGNCVFQQKIKFVPILKEDTTSFVNYLNKKHNIKLCFLGQIMIRSKNLRDKFLNTSYFLSKYDLFNEDKYNMYMVNNTHIFLNLNKNNSCALPFARICKLLSHKCIVISQYCNKEDEELFKDMVYFCSIEDIEKTFNNLSSKSPNELNDISNKIYIKFCNKFNANNSNLFLTK